MTTPSTTPAVRTGAPIWIELSTHDPQGAEDFYGQLFGWQFQDQGEAFGHYQLVAGPSGPLAGAMSTLMGPEGPTSEPTGPTAWTVYLGTGDIGATSAGTPSAGGSVLVAPMPVPDFGTMGVLAAPSGAVVGAWQPGPFTGFDLTMHYRTPVWFECLTTDFDADLAFYQQVFDWRPHEDSKPGEPRYVTNGIGEDAVCGLYDATSFDPPVEPHWRVYFAVDDCQTACETIRQLGGQVRGGPEESAYGPVASVADPQGAHFQIITIPAH
ncbi:hypothetical protein SAMN05443377_10296 [Propionibacterium cyclohexanicum]|uniref:VOC domain-containing protein n=1 Tax=Propionibacterium cyclohexanicum TaxID=64702 RepID=A0A1H9Q2W8_9ACTN|nr:VOC family protein [Propionibacterium cyclohexanicum]SER54722.1 hypothetical protein SAMN05443377_10296 [Propionibacterium cyclohexanicum]